MELTIDGLVVRQAVGVCLNAHMMQAGPNKLHFSLRHSDRTVQVKMK